MFFILKSIFVHTHFGLNMINNSGQIYKKFYKIKYELKI